MKLYVADEERLNTFYLPKKVSESFLFSYTSGLFNNELYFNIYSKDGQWYIKNNDNIIIDNSDEDIPLECYHHYEIKIKGYDNLLYLYVYDNINTYYYDFDISELQLFTIGCDNSDTIRYKDGLTTSNQIKVFKEAGSFFIEPLPNSKSFLFINKRTVYNKRNLKTGDIIFFNNIMIVWMNTFFRIYVPNDGVTFSRELKPIRQDIMQNNAYLQYDVEENTEDLYKENDYFFRKPRLTMTYTEESINIDPPNQKETKEDVPIIFQFGTGLTMLASSAIIVYKNIVNYKAGKSEKIELILSMVSAGAILLCSFLLPKIIKIYNKHLLKKKEKKRQEKYTAYLLKKQESINAILKKESLSIFDNNPSSKECFENLTGLKNRLYERELQDIDFLTIRVGVGNLPSSLKITAPEEKFTLEEDELLQNVYEIVESSKFLKNIPITLSLCRNFISSIICNFEYSENYLNDLILQLLFLHNPEELKVVLLTNEKNAEKWSYLKLVPHIYSDDKSIRFFAQNEDETKKILKELDDLFIERKQVLKEANEDISGDIEKNDYYKNFSTYYLIITDNYRQYKDIDFLKKLVVYNKNLGFSLLILGNVLKNLPNECNKYVYVTDKDSCLFEKEYSKSNQTYFSTEIAYPFIDMFKVAKELSNIPVQLSNNTFNLPTTLPFLEMYNVGNIEQLNVLNKWTMSNPIATLGCPVGVSPSGELFKLDLHEKFHGPHGLIAGSTGSGKSEFIITYILSMAVNYHPNEVQFVLIDYKGGGLAGAFENRETGVRIPHLAGTITNLDISEMHRALVSINSELKRRQQKFNEARDKLGESTIDIYKYQRFYKEGLLSEPIPHLFIISDEFAELKSQQPEFMDELISTARIGRSLGVHLVLATQKPSGVVNDQIWSNTRFRVCLKVQSKSDSMEMLKRPEAASIKETGRFYLQVGYDELFELGQSAWAGAQYIPAERVVRKVDDSLSFVNNTGDVIKTSNNINAKDSNLQKNYGDQLTNIVKYLNKIAIENNIKTNKLWLDSIPAEIFLSDLIEKYHYTTQPYIINPIIGELDDPAAQKQSLLTLDITNNGNTLVYGIPGSGKENFITTILTSICTKHTTDEINIY